MTVKITVEMLEMLHANYPFENYLGIFIQDPEFDAQKAVAVARIIGWDDVAKRFLDDSRLKVFHDTVDHLADVYDKAADAFYQTDDCPALFNSTIEPLWDFYKESQARTFANLYLFGTVENNNA